MNEKFAEEDLANNSNVRLMSLDEVEAVLVDWSVDPATLDAPWNSDYLL
ncbi:MAG TPA: hypothetical protein VLJ11_21540 [Bryobacteraceae bacterium]|nr:hypothetical protein [Bryobacteraceae bacterium]